MAYLLTDAAFLLIQRALFLFGDVTAILAGHAVLFSTDAFVLLVQLFSLLLAYFALFDFFVDPFILIFETAIYLFARWVGFLPLRVSYGAYRGCANHAGQHR